MKSCIVRNNGKLAISVDGKIISDVSFKSFRPTYNNVSDFYKAGVKLFNVYCSGLISALGVPYSLYGETWFGDNNYNFDSLDRQFEMFIENAPDAYFLLNVHLDSRDWWHDENPGRSRSFTHLSQIAADEKWRRDTADYLKACIKHCEEKFGDKIVAYYLLGGHTTEWFSDNDYEESHPIKLDAFRKYMDDESIDIPQKDVLEKPATQLFLDSKEDKTVISYRKFHNELIVDTVLYYAKTAQEVLNHNKLVGVFFGYILELRGERLWNAGHIGYDKLYQSPDIDIIATPSSYQFRSYDAPSACMLLSDTLDHYNKLYFVSFDHMNYNVKNLKGNPRRVSGDEDAATAMAKMAIYRTDILETPKQTIDAMQREYMQKLYRRVGMWWFDMLEGWYYDDELMAGVKSVVDVSKTVESLPSTSNSEVAVFVSSDSMYYVNKMSRANDGFICDQRLGLAHMGAPYDIFSTTDLTKVNAEKYKMIYFVNAFTLSDENRDYINNVLKKDGRTIVFAGPCDYIGDDGMSIERMEKMTGMKHEKADGPENLIACGDKEYGHANAIEPLFGVVDESAEKIGSFKNSGMTAVACKKEKDYTVYYSALGNLHAELLQNIAKDAGVHIYTKPGVATFVNSTFYGIYNTLAQETEMVLPKAGKYKEIFSGKIYETADGKITLPTGTQPAQMLIKAQ